MKIIAPFFIIILFNNYFQGFYPPKRKIQELRLSHCWKVGIFGKFGRDCKQLWSFVDGPSLSLCISPYKQPIKKKRISISLCTFRNGRELWVSCFFCEFSLKFSNYDDHLISKSNKTTILRSTSQHNGEEKYRQGQVRQLVSCSHLQAKRAQTKPVCLNIKFNRW